MNKEYSIKRKSPLSSIYEIKQSSDGFSDSCGTVVFGKEAAYKFMKSNLDMERCEIHGFDAYVFIKLDDNLSNEEKECFKNDMIGAVNNFLLQDYARFEKYSWLNNRGEEKWMLLQWILITVLIVIGIALFVFVGSPLVLICFLAFGIVLFVRLLTGKQK